MHHNVAEMITKVTGLGPKPLVPWLHTGMQPVKKVFFLGGGIFLDKDTNVQGCLLYCTYIVK